MNTGSFKDPDVAKKFATYPDDVRARLMALRELIFDAAAGAAGIGDIEETLTWNEPSYRIRGGSTVRIDWKASRPEHYAMYFNCNTRLVDTFREIYKDTFRFEGNRAIVFHKSEAVPAGPLKHCIALSLEYHRLKHLPLLGA